MRTKWYHLQPNQAIVQDILKYDLDYSNSFLHFTLNDPIDKYKLVLFLLSTAYHFYDILGS